jgi:hypothetical protein
MELDDLKNDWNEVNKPITAQPALTPGMIDAITQKKYSVVIQKIKYPEWIGSIVCLGASVYIMVNFSRLTTLYMQSIGIVSILLLLVMPAIGLLSMQRLAINDAVNKPYAAVLKQFAFQKIQFRKLQKLNIFLSYLLLVIMIVLLPMLFKGKDITLHNYYWVFAFPLGYIYLLFFSKLVKRYYDHSLKQAEELLKELEAV